MPQWAVLVVHGVGDTGPGVTVDNFLATLRVAQPRVRPDGQVEVHMLPEAPPPGAAAGTEVPLFPVHVRRALIAGAGVGPPNRAVFGEVYWADLSTIREGTLYLLLSLVSTIFSLRYVADQAAVMPLEPVRFTAGVARWWARWLRFLLHVAAVMLCGPVAALSALTACVVVAEYLVLQYFVSTETAGSTEAGLIAVGASAALVAGLASRYCCWCQSATTWTRFWFWFGLAAALLTGFVVWRRSSAAMGPLRWGHYAGAAAAATGALLCWYSAWNDASAGRRWLGVSLGVVAATGACLAVWWWIPGPSRLQWAAWGERVQALLGINGPGLRGIARYAALLMVALQGLFLTVGAVLLIALLPLGIALLFAPKGPQDKWCPALAAAYGATLVQLGLWLLVIPPLALVGVKMMFKDSPSAGAVELLLIPVRTHFVTHLILLLFVGIFVGAIWVSRMREVWQSSPPYSYPPPVPDIARLIVHVSILVALLASVTAGSVLSLVGFLLKWFSTGTLYGVDLGWISAPLSSDFANGVTNLIISGLLVVSTLLVKQLRDWLHILTDVINHFYRRKEPVPWPVGREDRPQAVDFEIQQRIEGRFHRVLNLVLDEPEVSHLTIVAHSQGTVIAVDVLALAALNDHEKNALRAKLNPVGGPPIPVDLITMGSPLTHLYQHYFPSRYPPLSIPAWGDLTTIVWDWTNVYRIDDFVGTFVESAAIFSHRRTPLPVNEPVGPGGHTGYWRQADVFRCASVAPLLPGS
jgi:hypothetical protein